MATPEPASQVAYFNTCVDDLINVLNLPAVWGGHKPAPIVTAVVQLLLAMLRQNFADSENVQSRVNGLLGVIKAQQALMTLESGEQKSAYCGREYHARGAMPLPRDELEQRVVERTEQLLAANAELIKQITERERAQEELRRANAKTTEVLESITEGFSAWDHNWRYIDMNERSAQLLGKSRGQLIGRSVWDLFPEAVGSETYRKCQQAMAERVPVYFEACFFNRWYENHVYPTREGLSVYWREITDRKRAEEGLKEANERIRMILDSITDEFNAFDRDWRFTYVNEPALLSIRRAKGEELTREDVLGKNVWEMFPEHVGSVFYQKYDEAMREHKAVHFEACSPGTDRWIEVNAYPTEEGLSVYCRDITERRRAEEKLRRSEAYLAEGQRMSHTGSWAWSVSTGELFWSLEHFRICGVNPETFKPTVATARQLIHPEDLAAANQAFDAAIRARSDFDRELRIIRPDGTIRFVHSVGHPAFNESGELTEYVGTIVDTTEGKQAEETLHKVQAELAHVSRVNMMGELAASIAHEIHQPLGAIVNNSNACLGLFDRSAPEREVREALLDIISDAERASSIVRRIRALSKRTPPEKTAFAVEQAIGEVVIMAFQALMERHIEVRTEMAEGLPAVSADRLQLQEVLLNLLMNAIDATSAVEEEQRLVTIGADRGQLEDRAMIVITVQDLGRGFKPEDSERLFEAFYTTKPHGLGMGLRISRSIVEAHGGRLWATANAGPGATFHCALPVAGGE
jgi:PAS domain S-box-containing protein